MSDDKIRAKLVDQLQSRDMVDFWVYFDAKADLSAASGIKDWNARGTAVVRTLRRTAEDSQASVRQELNLAGVDYQAFWATNAIKVSQGDLDLAERLAGHSEVDALLPTFEVDVPEPSRAQRVHEVNSVEWGIANIKADQVWDLYGVRGAGVVVGHIDSGVDYTHPALVDQYRGNNGDGTFTHDYSWWDPSQVCADPEPCDNSGHGTHTMGTMVGDDGAGNQVGVAPQATWIAAKGCETNNCSDDALVSSGQFMLAPTDLTGANPRPDLRPQVVNNSWGQPNGAAVNPFYRDIVTAWTAAGIFGVFANGNNGPGCNTAGSPGDYLQAWSVGAYDSSNTIASFSSRGPGESGDIKPNISAPGVAVRSSLPGGQYASFNGTSMATPHVTGAIALLWSASPALLGDVSGTKDLLDDSATDHPDAQCGGSDDDNNVYGEGQLDALALLDAAPIAETGTLTGIVTDAATNEPIGAAKVIVIGEGTRTVLTAADGTYTTRLPAGDYQATARVFGYADQTAPVTITSDQTATQNFPLEATTDVQISGSVTDASGQGWPMYAKITVDSVPNGVTYTDPVDGSFRISLPARSTYRFTVSAQYPGYLTETEDVVVGPSDLTQDFGLDVEPESCAAPGYDYAWDGVFETFDTATTPPSWSVVDNIESGQVWTFGDPGSRGNLTGGDGGVAVVDSDAYGADGSQDTALVSPLVDLTGVDEPFIRFDQDHNRFHDTADVDLSIDGGETWTTVRRQQADVRKTVTEIPIPQAAGQDDVRVRFRYYDASFEWWWQVDNVLIGSRVRCEPIDAGLVVGHVRDASTGAGLNGATVTDDTTGQTVTTTATPDDPVLDDGIYAIAASTGRHPFTAAADDYTTQSVDVDVETGRATAADFQLRAGGLTVAPDSLDVSAEFSGSATRQLTIGNGGTTPMTVQLADDAAWLSTDLSSTQLQPGESRPVTVTANADGLTAGEHHGSLIVTGAASRSSEAVVPVRFKVAAPYSIAVNVGGDTFVDNAGVSWRGDKRYVSGGWGHTGTSTRDTTTAAIAGTAADRLYRDRRTGTFGYRFDGVPTGSYRVTLRFAELSRKVGIGDRKISVSVEGQPVLQAHDVVRHVGRLTADQHVTTIWHTGGAFTVTIRGVRGSANPMLNALRLLQIE